MDITTDSIDLMFGDCLERLDEIDDQSIDSVVTDPPYGLSFMGKRWDHGVPGVDFWIECLRVAKPGSYLLAFGGTRTSHRLACAIEDAGWEIRDGIMWVFGTGFPKSKDVSRAIDKAAGVEREIIGQGVGRTGPNAQPHGTSFSDDGYQWPGKYNITEAATDAAKQWQGWGTALKPAYEPIIMARKPLIGTVAQNVLEYGCGGLNIDGCRIGSGEVVQRAAGSIGFEANRNDGYAKGTGRVYDTQGRWPANFIHDGSEEVVELFPQTPSNSRKLKAPGVRQNGVVGFTRDKRTYTLDHDDSSSTARFFYCAKASRAERDEGLQGVPLTSGELTNRIDGSAGLESPRAGAGRTSGGLNNHPTVKPVALMEYLCRLVTPPNGMVLDPFMGSGSTGIACRNEGFRFTGIEKESEHFSTAACRIFKWGS